MPFPENDKLSVETLKNTPIKPNAVAFEHYLLLCQRIITELLDNSLSAAEKTSLNDVSTTMTYCLNAIAQLPSAPYSQRGMKSLLETSLTALQPLITSNTLRDPATQIDADKLNTLIKLVKQTQDAAPNDPSAPLSSSDIATLLKAYGQGRSASMAHLHNCLQTQVASLSLLGKKLANETLQACLYRQPLPLYAALLWVFSKNMEKTDRQLAYLVLSGQHSFNADNLQASEQRHKPLLLGFLHKLYDYATSHGPDKERVLKQFLQRAKEKDPVLSDEALAESHDVTAWIAAEKRFENRNTLYRA